MNITLSTARRSSRGVPAGWLASGLARRGISLDVASKALGFENSFLLRKIESLPLDIYLKLFEWAARELDEPLLGAIIAVESNPAEYGVLGYLSSNGATLRENLSFMERYHDIFSPEFSFRFADSGETTWCTYSEADLPGIKSPQDIIFSMSMILKTVRESATEAWQPRQCSFTFPEPNDTSAYHAYFGSNLTFDHPANKLEFETALLDKPNNSADASLLPILLQQANQLLDDIRDDQDILEKIRLLILASLDRETINTTQAAERLNMSVRSLHRHLRQRDTSFKQLREEVIIKLAKEALLDTNLSITAIASRLNYSETSAFDRLFKRATGITPRQYRQKSGSAEGLKRRSPTA